MYTYYYKTKNLLKRIYYQDEVTNNDKNTVTLSLFKEQFLNNTIIKFISGFKNFDFQFCIIKYHLKFTSGLYKVYKFTKFILMILHIQNQI